MQPHDNVPEKQKKNQKNKSWPLPTTTLSPKMYPLHEICTALRRALCFADLIEPPPPPISPNDFLMPFYSSSTCSLCFAAASLLPPVLLLLLPLLSSHHISYLSFVYYSSWRIHVIVPVNQLRPFTRSSVYRGRLGCGRRQRL